MITQPPHISEFLVTSGCPKKLKPHGLLEVRLLTIPQCGN
jgi:hypothetical protein